MKRSLVSKVVVYTDGACEPNPGPGGWAAILHYQLRDGIHEKEISWGHLNTTNNRMEVTGVIEALKLLKRPCDVTVFSDSKYVVNSIGEWLDGNPRNGSHGWMVGWKKKRRCPPKRRSLERNRRTCQTSKESAYAMDSRPFGT